MRHLPWVLNVRGAERLSNQDKYFEAMFFKIKMQKTRDGQTIKNLNKDRISKSAQRKFYSFRSLF